MKLVLHRKIRIKVIWLYLFWYNELMTGSLSMQRLILRPLRAKLVVQEGSSVMKNVLKACVLLSGCFFLNLTGGLFRSCLALKHKCLKPKGTISQQIIPRVEWTCQNCEAKVSKMKSLMFRDPLTPKEASRLKILVAQARKFAEVQSASEIVRKSCLVELLKVAQDKNLL